MTEVYPRIVGSFGEIQTVVTFYTLTAWSSTTEMQAMPSSSGKHLVTNSVRGRPTLAAQIENTKQSLRLLKGVLSQIQIHVACFKDLIL